MVAFEPSEEHATDPSLPPHFNLNDLRSSRIVPRLIQALIFNQWSLGFLRCICPIPAFRNWAMLTRYDDVQEVLGQDRIFQVPFGEKVRALNAGPNFLLGMQGDEDSYWRYQKQVMLVIRPDDVRSVIAPMAAELSQIIVEQSRGRLDAIQELITFVPTRLCESYFGVAIKPQERKDFANWTIAMSTFMFADPNDDPRLRRVAACRRRSCASDHRPGDRQGENEAKAGYRAGANDRPATQRSR